MKKNIIYLLIVNLIMSLSLLNIAFANNPDGAPGVSGKPVSVDIMRLPPPTQNINILYKEVERGNVPDPAALELIKNKTLPAVSNDPNATRDNSDSPNQYLHYSWFGPIQNGWGPPDPDIAVGPFHVFVATNEQFHIYDRTTAQHLLTTNTFQNFFGLPSTSNIFDPKVIYDPWAQRWLFIVLNRSGLSSFYYVAVSSTSDPTGTWYYYQLNAHVDGSTVTTNWADYPGLGFTAGSINSGAIAITSDQYDQGNSFKYAKVRILKRSELYSESTVTWYDFWNLKDANNAFSFSVKPAHNWTSNTALFFINTKPTGGSVVTVWKIVSPTDPTPTLNIQNTVNVSPYQPPPSAKCPASDSVDAGDDRTQDVAYSNGFLFTAYPRATNWGSGNNSSINYLKINSTTGALVADIYLGLINCWYIFPKVVPIFDPPYNGDSVALSFSVTSPTGIYPDARVTGIAGTTWLGSSIVKSGTGNLSSSFSRYGDYSGIAIDPYQNGFVWTVGEIAKPGSWGTAIGYYTMRNTTPIGVENENTKVPDKYSLSQNYPNPFNPFTKIEYAVPENSFVKFVVYDITGREIETLVNETKKAGTYEVFFNGTDLSSGTYLYKITTGKFSQTKIMLLIK
jgi:hypothetical protein